MVGQNILLIVHIVLALTIIGLILLQHGKGAEVGAAFGSGASQTLFGSRGSASFLAKITALFAICFAVTSISMGYLASHNSTGQKSILDTIDEVQRAAEVPSIAETKKAEKAKKADKTNPANPSVEKQAVKQEKAASGNAVKHTTTDFVTDIAEPGNLDELELSEEVKALEQKGVASKKDPAKANAAKTKPDAVRM